MPMLISRLDQLEEGDDSLYLFSNLDSKDMHAGSQVSFRIFDGRHRLGWYSQLPARCILIRHSTHFLAGCICNYAPNCFQSSRCMVLAFISITKASLR